MDAYAVRLAELREARGLTQRALASQSRLSPTTINEIETGKRVPRQSTKRKIAKVLQSQDWKLADQDDGGQPVEALIEGEMVELRPERLRVWRVQKAGLESVSPDEINHTILAIEDSGGVVTDIRLVVTGEYSQYVDAWIIYDDQGENR